MVSQGYSSLAEVRAAKSELAAVLRRTLRAFLAARYGDAGTLRGVGIGIGRNRSGQYELTVRITDRWLRSSPVLRAVLAATRGVADCRFIGRVTAAAGAFVPPRVRPLRIGVGVSHCGVRGVGTAGFYVRKPNHPGRVALVSNAHVLKPQWCIGTPGVPAGAHETLQPGTGQSGTVPADIIGSLIDAAAIDPTGVNEIDAACSLLDPALVTPDLNAFPPGLRPPGRLRPAGRVTGFFETPEDLLGTGDGPPDPLLAVAKCGAVSGWTSGHVTDIDADIDVKFPFYRYTIRFENVLAIEGRGPGGTPAAFGVPGDSGSAVLDGQGRIVGLLFAGQRRSDRTAYAVPIATVRRHFPNLVLA